MNTTIEKFVEIAKAHFVSTNRADIAELISKKNYVDYAKVALHELEEKNAKRLVGIFSKIVYFE